MFLRNYDNALVLAHFDSTSDTSPTTYPTSNRYINGSGTWGDGFCNVKRTNGTIDGFRLGSYYSSTYYMTPLASLRSTNICLGTGSKEVSYEDYEC